MITDDHKAVAAAAKARSGSDLDASQPRQRQIRKLPSLPTTKLTGKRLKKKIADPFAPLPTNLDHDQVESPWPILPDGSSIDLPAKAQSGPQIIAQSERHPSNLPHPSTNSTPESDHLGDSVATLTSPPANARIKGPRRRRKPAKPHQQRASHLAVSFQEVSTGGESSFSAREDTDGAPSPPLSPGASNGYESNPPQTKSDFSKDFDFQAGLQAESCFQSISSTIVTQTTASAP
ncbi:hypothetical protein DFH28DRAFT_1107710 [Melampsora americana]|nr:hypothetical protein DFH28DRAFT_1107710 [Melampsora americana]